MSDRLTVADLEIERNGKPLEIELDNGEIFTFIDPKRLGLNSALTIGSLTPTEQVKLVLKSGDYDRLMELSKTDEEIDLYFFEALMKKYLEHFKVLPQGEAQASSR